MPLPSANQFPQDIAGAMEVANYGKATPEMKLAFMIGYLAGAFANERFKSRAAKLAWAKARAEEMCEICRSLDVDLQADLAQKLQAIQAVRN